MEYSKKQRIEKFFSKLMESKEVESIMENLHINNVLTDVEMATINSKDTQPEKGWTLYRIFLTKKENLYNPLKTALRQSKQMGTESLLEDLVQFEESPLAEKLEKPVTTFPADEIKYDPADLLNEGCFGAFVYRGTYGIRDVAVKVIFDNGKPGQVKMEIKSLVKCEDHVNVVKYHTYKHEPMMREYILAFELCATNLEKYILNKEQNIHLPFISHLKILDHITNGIVHLHKYGILHRDLNPSNILMVKKDEFTIVKIADFGISKWLVNERSSVTLTSAVGTVGYRAPEVLEYIDMAEMQKKGKTLFSLKNRIKCSSDIFSLGCIYYYVISGGNNPFGATTRDINESMRKKSSPKVDTIYDNPYGICLLIQDMVAQQADKRPTATDILAHHIFWTKQKQLEFLIKICPLYIKNVGPNNEIDKQFNKICSSEGWMTKIRNEGDPLTVYKYLSTNTYRTYDGTSVGELLWAIRNMDAHSTQLPDDVQEAFGDMPNYWLSRYVYLVHHVWMSFQSSELRLHKDIAKYYKNTNTFRYQ